MLDIHQANQCLSWTTSSCEFTSRPTECLNRSGNRLALSGLFEHLRKPGDRPFVTHLWPRGFSRNRHTERQIGLISFQGERYNATGQFTLREVIREMPFKTQDIEEPALNLTPMIDIVMLLVIFFMVGTQFADDESQYEIELPQVTEAQPLTPLPDEIVVNVTVDGTILIDGEPLSVSEFEDFLFRAQRRFADQAVVIRGRRQRSVPERDDHSQRL